MSREIKKYKFNKNHIEIFTIKDPEMPIFKIPVFEQRSSSLYVHNRTYGLYENKPLIKEVKKKSPLGFYYMSKEIIRSGGNHEIKDGAVSRTIVTIPMPGEKNTYYQIKYVTLNPVIVASFGFSFSNDTVTIPLPFSRTIIVLLPQHQVFLCFNTFIFAFNIVLI